MVDPRRVWLIPTTVIVAELLVEIEVASAGALACGALQLAFPGLVILLVYAAFAYMQGRGAKVLIEDPRVAADSRDELLALIGTLSPEARSRLVAQYVKARGLTLVLLASVAGLVPLVSCYPRLILLIFLGAVAVGMYSAFLRARLMSAARSSRRH